MPAGQKGHPWQSSLSNKRRLSKGHCSKSLHHTFHRKPNATDQSEAPTTNRDAFHRIPRTPSVCSWSQQFYSTIQLSQHRHAGDDRDILQIPHFTIWSIGGHQCGTLLCIGWTMDSKFLFGSHHRLKYIGETEQGASWFFNLAWRKFTFSCKCGFGPLDGDCTIDEKNVHVPHSRGIIHKHPKSSGRPPPF